MVHYWGRGIEILLAMVLTSLTKSFICSLICSQQCFDLKNNHVFFVFGHPALFLLLLGLCRFLSVVCPLFVRCLPAGSVWFLLFGFLLAFSRFCLLPITPFVYLLWLSCSSFLPLAGRL